MTRYIIRRLLQAIPLLFINAGLASLSKHVIQVLDEQSTGLLAENIEKKFALGGDPLPGGRERKQGAAA